ncbi:MAG: UbiD family decarboxylase [bacterium]|nr:UbiD family decarboxylase [bacterium]
MAFKDLREYIEKLEASGDLVKVKKEVDWNLEIGAIIRRCNETQGPATLFENIKGYPSNYRVMGGPIATFRRAAITMGLDPSTHYTKLLDTFIERSKRPIKPLIVSTGPCKENIIVGDKVDLLSFPTPLIHFGDGGRYLGTWNTGANKDPDSDWVNWGMYRLMVHDRYSTGINVSSHQHGGIILQKYEKNNLPMPYVAFIGSDPVVDFLSAIPIPYGINEADIVGAIRGEPLELVRAETCDLLVPASAEIILEGVILPGERKGEGPHGEYAGYQQSGIVDRPVFHVKAITHRNNPILTVSNIGTPIDDSHICTGSIGTAANIKMELLRTGLPIKGIYIPPQSCHHLAIVSTETPYPHIATRIACLIFAASGGAAIARVIVVNDDIDPTNMDEVIHAFATKCHPVRGEIVIPHALSSPLTGFLDPQERTKGFGAKAIYDCTWPLDWPADKIPPRSSFRDIYPADIQDKVLSNWAGYGFK